MRRVFVDSWGWLAYINRDDSHHGAVRSLLDELFVTNVELSTSHMVVAETLNGIARARHRPARERRSPLVVLAEQFRVWRRDEALEFFDADGADMHSTLGLFAKYSDHPLSYIDCLSIHLCKRHGIGEIVTGDEDFDRVGSGLRRIP